jgi:hypothetical protein
MKGCCEHTATARVLANTMRSCAHRRGSAGQTRLEPQETRTARAYASEPGIVHKNIYESQHTTAASHGCHTIARTCVYTRTEQTRGKTVAMYADKPCFRPTVEQSPGNSIDALFIEVILCEKLSSALHAGACLARLQTSSRRFPTSPACDDQCTSSQNTCVNAL